MRKLLSEIKAAVSAEYDRAVAKFGVANNSPHESYAVIKEEYEEARDELRRLKKIYKDYWKFVKNNDNKNATLSLHLMQDYAEKLACEAVQVAAMCHKATIRKKDNPKDVAQSAVQYADQDTL